ncbi:TonB-dependent receptor [Thalassotalea euphylliae]|uniref:TonB-dependent receptor n=1 Tax=Thalassotalea euphylliae TaxID=1655234 RepID=A0A3E0UBU3_9GAMM|nr:TonB-dependent receptor [Thalassotalea euphylliae]REL34346.1 TonB-dependent receptor [Thalassotalea euphylliae]
MNYQRSLISKAIATHLLGAAVASVSLTAFAEDDKEIEVIEVTAQKRVQNIQDVPVSVSAISGDFIANSELSTFADIVSLAPGITLDQGAETRTTSISIRGVGSSQNNMGIEPSTTMMIDGEVLPRSSALNGDLMDTERVEVLRGPQGTLFGKNTSSGIVHYISKRPELGENYGKVKFATDEYSLKQTQLTTNFGVTDDVALRLNLLYSDTDGFMENLKPGQDDIGARDSQGARLQALYKPSDIFDLLVRAEYKESSSNCCGSTIIETDPTRQFNAHLNHPAIRDFVQNNTGWGEFATYMSDDQISDIENTGFSVEANYDFGDYLLTYTGHYRDWSLFNNTEFGGATLDNTEFYFGGENAFQSRQHELRISADNEKVSFVAGLFYQNVDQSREAKEAFCNQTARDTFWSLENWEPGNEANDGNPTDFDVDGNLLACRNGWQETGGIATGGGLYNQIAQYRTTVESTNKAVFGQFDFHLSEALTAFVGARYLDEDSELYYEGGRNATRALLKQLNGRTLNAADQEALGFTHEADSNDTEFIYRLGAQYRVNKDLMFYGSYGTGYKGVGWYNAISNAPADIANDELNPVKPEKSKSVELGMRSDWFDNDLRLNVTVFRTEYEDFQERVRVEDEDEEAEDGTVGRPLFVNAGKVISQGLEVEWKAILSENITLDGTYAFIDATYDEFDGFFQNCPAGLKGTDECMFVNDGALEVLILEGRELAQAPEHQFRIDVRYDFDFMGQESHVRLGYRWKDEIQYRFDHNPDTIHPSFGLLDLYVGTEGTIGEYDYNVNLFVKNLTDEEYYTRLVTRSNQVGGGLRGVIGKDSQRYWGASVTFHF